MRHVKYHIAAIVGSICMAFTVPAISNADDSADEGEITAAPSSTEQMETAGSDAEIRHTIEKYRTRINRLQADHGAYHDQLSEAQLSLGLSLSALDEHAEAAESFRTALHISRVNHGLHSMNQLPYLELLIQENTILNDQADLYKNYHYLYWLYKRNYGDNSPELLPVINRVARWHMDNYQGHPDIPPYRHLWEAQKLYEKAISVIETEYGENDPRLVKPLYELALSNYHIAADASREEDFKVEFKASARTSYYSRADYYEEDTTADRILDSYFEGKQALERVVELHERNPEGLSVQSHAHSLTYLGDWNMLFDRPRSAVDRYSQAYALLAENGKDDETIRQIFGSPHRLPTIPLPDQGETRDKTVPEGQQDREREAASYAIVAFDVTSSGRTRNIRVVESRPGDNNSVTRTARRAVAVTKFRPRFENGKPVTTTDVNIKYIINE